MLEVKNLKYSYNSDYQALKGVSLKIEKGEMVALLGKNGAGKSTLFLHLNGIYEPDEGQVFIDGEELKYDKKSLLKFRQKVGIVFQNPDDQIFAPTVESFSRTLMIRYLPLLLRRTLHSDLLTWVCRWKRFRTGLKMH